MAHGYFVSQISDNLGRTPEGYLVCRDAVIGRTGFQTYSVGDLPREAAVDLGIDVSDPAAAIDLFRHPRDVFADEAITSFEGKPCTDNHPPGKAFVTPENIKELGKGHVQNVRKGEEQLDSGDWPIIADIIITDPNLMAKVESGQLRELSCGYDFSIAKDGEKIYQIDIRGNHVAVVPKGRAGAEARIIDAAPAESESVKAEPEPAKAAVSAPATDSKLSPRPGPTKGESHHRKEQPTVKKNWLKELIGRGLKAIAADESTSPEDLAEAAQAVKDAEPPKKEEEKKDEHAEDRRSDDRRADDRRADDTHRSDDRHADDSRRSDDRRADDSHRSDDRRADDRHRSDDRRADDRRADDSRATDRRSRMHAALDRMLGKHMDDNDPELQGIDPVEDPQETSVADADLEELRSLLGDYFEEEEHKPEHAHAADARTNDGSAQFIEEKQTANGIDRARAAALDILLDLKPHVARVNDTRLTEAFNKIARTVKGTSKARTATGGYGTVARAAVTRAADRLPQADDKQVKDLQAAYDARRAGKTLQEVTK